MRATFSSKELRVLAVVLAFCSIVYELLLANTLALATGNIIWWQSMTIGFYIAGLGLGAWLSSKWAEKRPLNAELLFRIELALTIFGAVSVVSVYGVNAFYRMTDYLNYISSDYVSAFYLQSNFYLKSLFFMAVESLTLAIGVLSGYELPILMQLNRDNGGKLEDNSILGQSYIGTLAGTLCFAFFCVPRLGIVYTSVFASALNLLVCLYLAFSGKLRLKAATMIPLFLAALIIGGITYKAELWEQRYLKVIYLFHKYVGLERSEFKNFFAGIDELPPVERKKSLYQYIDIFKVRNEGGDSEDATVLALDTNFQFSTYNEKYYHEGFTHIPIKLTGLIPEKVLVLGAGDGLLIRELLKYPGIRAITHVELDPEMIDLAKNRSFLSELNRSSLNDPRVKSIVGDAFYFLRTNNTPFDAIYIDFPYPKSFDLSRLYSIEFYTFVLKSLGPEGFAVLDAPLFTREKFDKYQTRGRPVLTTVFSEDQKENNSVMISTTYFAGFQEVFPYKVDEESFLLLTNRQAEFDYGADNLDKEKFEVLDETYFRAIQQQFFPHQKRRSFINSIFSPRLFKNMDF